MGKNSRVLVISDLHSPFYHVDTIPFLTAIKEFIKPDKIVFTGDEIDAHSLSFHDKDPDLPFSPSSELEKAIEYLQPLYELFPKADILESNHDVILRRNYAMQDRIREARIHFFYKAREEGKTEQETLYLYAIWIQKNRDKLKLVD